MLDAFTACSYLLLLVKRVSYKSENSASLFILTARSPTYRVLTGSVIFPEIAKDQRILLTSRIVLSPPFTIFATSLPTTSNNLSLAWPFIARLQTRLVQEWSDVVFALTIFSLFLAIAEKSEKLWCSTVAKAAPRDVDNATIKKIKIKCV